MAAQGERTTHLRIVDQAAQQQPHAGATGERHCRVAEQQVSQPAKLVSYLLVCLSYLLATDSELQQYLAQAQRRWLRLRASPIGLATDLAEPPSSATPALPSR